MRPVTWGMVTNSSIYRGRPAAVTPNPAISVSPRWQKYWSFSHAIGEKVSIGRRRRRRQYGFHVDMCFLAVGWSLIVVVRIWLGIAVGAELRFFNQLVGRNKLATLN